MKTLEKPLFDPKAFITLKCPLCDTELDRVKVTTSGTWFKIILGVALTPILAGFYIIYRALKGRPEKFACPSCGRSS